MKLKLYGAMLSPFVRKVRIMLALKKVDYDIDIKVSPLLGKLHDLPPTLVQVGSASLSVTSFARPSGQVTQDR